jgi:hypothetical protein
VRFPFRASVSSFPANRVKGKGYDGFAKKATSNGPQTSIKIKSNYSAAIHQDGEKPVLSVPYFFRELLGFLPLKQGHAE